MPRVRFTHDVTTTFSFTLRSILIEFQLEI